MPLKKNSVQLLDRIWRRRRKGKKAEDKWLCLREPSDQVCGLTKGPVRCQETCLWNDMVDNAIKKEEKTMKRMEIWW